MAGLMPIAHTAISLRRPPKVSSSERYGRIAESEPSPQLRSNLSGSAPIGRMPGVTLVCGNMPNELVVLFVALTAFLAYVAVAVPLAHESRVSRGAAFGFLGYYAVANAVYACVCAGVVAKTPWMAV